jgi:DNA invertase Pin-like site-specific DNA recombinase
MLAPVLTSLGRSVLNTMSKRKGQTLQLTPGWVEYLRTSDEDVQAPERSQASQSRLNHERLINESGLPCLDKYADIFTGKATDRKNYQRLLADARLGKFSHVAIAFVDRFGRNDIEGLRAFDELISLGITIRIATYPSLDPTKSDGRMIVGVLFNMARFESDRNSERVKENMRTKLLDGGWNALAPDGYLNTQEKTKNLPKAERLKHAREKKWVITDPAQFKVWREAWDLLLEDKLSLDDICETLHARGYRLRSGRQFVTITPTGKRKAIPNTLSKVFHNWFYAGWVVADNNCAKIPPKTVRGEWEPVVTTEEFELGLSILERRNQNREHRPKHFYLLQRMIWLQHDSNGNPVKLICSTSNAHRKSGGVPYYCVPSSKYNFLCREIDEQIANYIANIQVDCKWLPKIRETFMADVEHFLGKPNVTERALLEKTLKSLDEEELASARLHAKGKMSEEVWDTLWKGWQDQRRAIQATLRAIDDACEAHIASLDDALRLIAKAGILFEKLDKQGQRQLLQHMVERVVINPEGLVLRIELRTPFSYLRRLADRNNECPPIEKTELRNGKKKSSVLLSNGTHVQKVQLLLVTSTLSLE